MEVAYLYIVSLGWENLFNADPLSCRRLTYSFVCVYAYRPYSVYYRIAL